MSFELKQTDINQRNRYIFMRTMNPLQQEDD